MVTELVPYLDDDDTISDAWVDAVSDAVNPSDWTAVTFLNSWTNASGGYQACQYRKVGDMVQVRGRVAGGTTGTAAFNLPTGYRPPAGLSIASVHANSTPSLCLVNVEPGGNVVIYGSSLSLVGLLFSFSVTA